MIRLKFFVLLICSSALGQNNLEFLPLIAFDPKVEASDLSKIDSVFKDQRLVGIGECTHGTSEFTLMRHRIFKHLVETNEFNTVFVEADYSACQRLNRYVQGETDDVDNALFELLYFAWTTEEMRQFVEWIRIHNLNSSNKIQIIGCDMQTISDDKIEIERLLKLQAITASIPTFFDQLKAPYQDANQVKKAIDEWTAFYNSQLIHKVEAHDANLIDATIIQFLNHKLNNSNQYNYRDSCMAQNILAYLNHNPNSKGIWMAHNGHVSKTEHKHLSNHSYKTAGQFLDESLGSTYMSIAQTTNKGHFNAWKYIENKPVFSVFELKKSKRNTLEKTLSKLDADILLCNFASIKNIHRLSYTEIGHTFGKTMMNYKISRYKKIHEGKFDYVIFFQATVQTHMLNR